MTPSLTQKTVKTCKNLQICKNENTSTSFLQESNDCNPQRYSVFCRFAEKTEILIKRLMCVCVCAYESSMYYYIYIYKYYITN